MSDVQVLQVKREELKEVVIEVTSQALEAKAKENKETIEKTLDEKLKGFKESFTPKEKRDPNQDMGNFIKYLYTKDIVRDPDKAKEIRKTLDPQDIATSADGGILTPTITRPEIFRLMEEFGQGRRYFRTIPMGKAPVLTLPSKLTGATVTRVAENVAITDTKVTLTTMTLTASKVAAIVAFTTELMEDNIVDMGAYVNELLAESFAEEEDGQFYTGTGSPHTGLFNTSAVYALNDDAGTDELQVINADSITYADLVKCAFNIKQNYLSGASWFMHRTVYAKLLNILDGMQRPIISNPGENRSSMFGYPIVLIEKAPAASVTTAGMPLIILGNTNKNSFIGIKRDLTATVLTEATIDSVNLAENDLIGLRVTKRDAFDDGLTSGYSVIKIAEA
jgi:HK97 family phage major capsid protein